MERLNQMAEGLGLFYEWRVRYEEGEAAFRAAAGLAGPATGRPEASAGSLLVRVKALAWQGHFCELLGRNGLAETYYSKA